jgi:hypothetical protein
VTTPPRLLTDYDPVLTRISLSALSELALALASYRDSLVLVGGWVPYLLVREHGRGDFAHVGSIDIDLAVDPDRVDREAYATIVQLIEGRGYEGRLSRTGEEIPFSFTKRVPGDGREFDIQVDFLTSNGTGRHRHRQVQRDLPARVAKGCGLAFRHNVLASLDGPLPDGGEAVCQVRMLDIPGCIGMKGIVLGERYKEKDAYDVYSVVGHCLGGPEDVARVVAQRMADADLSSGLDVIAGRFRSIRAEGPAWVATFIQPTDLAMRERVTADVFVVMDRFLRALRT